MKPNKVIQIAWKGLTKNKLRSLLTMLGVIIGVSAVIIMIAISAGAEAAIEEEITSLGSNLVFVQASMSRGGFGPGGGGGNTSQGLTYDDAYAIVDEVNGVKGMVVEQTSSQTVKAGNIAVDSVTVLGTTMDFPSVRDMEIAEGRYLKGHATRTASCPDRRRTRSGSRPVPGTPGRAAARGPARRYWPT